MNPYLYKFKSHAKNVNGRDFAVGDIHGYYSVLEGQLEELGFDYENDRLFALGDLIDRGPESKRAIEFIKKPWFHGMKGNHEVMMWEYHTGHSWLNTYGLHGGDWFIGLSPEERQMHVDALTELPNIVEVETVNGRIGLVHGDCPVDSWETFKKYHPRYVSDSLWSFNSYNLLKYGAGRPWIKDIDYVIHGHSSVAEPENYGNRFYIDTGAFAKRLGIIEINNPMGILVLHP